jgi:hypothetical protein
MSAVALDGLFLPIAKPADWHRSGMPYWPNVVIAAAFMQRVSAIVPISTEVMSIILSSLSRAALFECYKFTTYKGFYVVRRLLLTGAKKTALAKRTTQVHRGAEPTRQQEMVCGFNQSSE